MAIPECKEGSIPEWIVNAYGGDWFACFEQTLGTVRSGNFTTDARCHNCWAPGWGGTLTDSWSDTGPIYNGANPAPGTPEMDYTFRGESSGEPFPADQIRNLKLSAVDDTTKFGILWEFSDAGQGCRFAENAAYPELCRDRWGYNIWEGPCNAGVGDTADGCPADWLCAYPPGPNADPAFWNDPSKGAQYARHLGGNNIGFLDGHAAWWPARSIYDGFGNWQNQHPQLHGLECNCTPDSPVFR